MAGQLDLSSLWVWRWNLLLQRAIQDYNLLAADPFPILLQNVDAHSDPPIRRSRQAVLYGIFTFGQGFDPSLDSIISRLSHITLGDETAYRVYKLT